MERSSRAVVLAFELSMNLSATGGPTGASASQTSAKPPRPRHRFNLYPGDGSAPAPMGKAPGVVDRIFGEEKANTVSPSRRAGGENRPADRITHETLAHDLKGRCGARRFERAK